MIHEDTASYSQGQKYRRGVSKPEGFGGAADARRARRPMDWLRQRRSNEDAALAAARKSASSYSAVGSRFTPRPAQVLSMFDLALIACSNAAMLLGVHGRLGVLSFAQAAIASVCIITANMVFLYAMGCFRRDAIVSKQNAISRLPIVIGLAAVVFFLALHFGLPLAFPQDRVYLSISRCATISFVCAGVSLVALVISRYVFFAMMHRQWFQRRIMVIGSGPRASHLLSLMNHEPHKSHAHLIFVDEDVLRARNAEPADGAKPGRSGCKSPEKLATEHGVDEIVIAVDDSRGLPFEGLLACKVRGVPITDYHSFIERETGRVDLRFIDPSYLVYSHGFQMRALDRIAKRSLDILFSLVLLSICLPVFAMASLAIWLEGGGAIFYRQERVTQGDRVFWLYKLRTMRPDAEKDGARWASSSDSRITKVGKFLRRTRIDEIPQILNILKGDMSLVGPRPERPVFVDEIGKEVGMFALRHGVKTGLTGWAQINYPYGASIEDAARKLEYDLYYMKNYNWFRDISIILQTIRIVILQEGVR